MRHCCKMDRILSVISAPTINASELSRLRWRFSSSLASDMYANHVHLCSYPHCKTCTLEGLELKMKGKGKNKKQKNTKQQRMNKKIKTFPRG